MSPNNHRFVRSEWWNKFLHFYHRSEYNIPLKFSIHNVILRLIYLYSSLKACFLFHLFINLLFSILCSTDNLLKCSSSMLWAWESIMAESLIHFLSIRFNIIIWYYLFLLYLIELIWRRISNKIIHHFCILIFIMWFLLRARKLI